MTPSLDAFFLPATPGRDGQRFCLLRAPSVRAGPSARGAVVYVHPFAEEMNKTRRMAALQARALAGAGFAVLQVDLHGCGDSSGDFADATWQGWIDDAVRAARWLVDRHPGPLWFWGLRAGCLIAAEAAARIETPADLLLWQPVAAGKVHLQQFLRLKVAGEMIGGASDGKPAGGGQNKGLMDALKQRLARGDAVEIAGYALSPEVAAGLEAATLVPPARGGRVVWRDVASQPDAGLSPASERTVAAWREHGIEVDAATVAGPAFWQTTEIEVAPALVESSLAALDRTAHRQPTATAVPA